MPKARVGLANCPHIYIEEISISYDAEFCDIDNKRCVGNDCVILKEIKKKRASVTGLIDSGRIVRCNRR